MSVQPTRFPVPFDAETLDRLWTTVEQLQADHDALLTLLGVHKSDQRDHPIVGSPVHVRSNDGQGHTTCMPAICVQAGEVDNPDVITVVAFTRGGEGIGPQPAARRTDVHRSVGDHLSWHWPDDPEAHAWRPPRRIDD